MKLRCRCLFLLRLIGGCKVIEKIEKKKITNVVETNIIIWCHRPGRSLHFAFSLEPAELSKAHCGSFACSMVLGRQGGRVSRIGILQDVSDNDEAYGIQSLWVGYVLQLWVEHNHGHDSAYRFYRAFNPV